MINPVKLHDDLWSISLTSMFNWSMGSNNGTETLLSAESDSEGSGKAEQQSRQGQVDDSQSQQQQSFYHFPFPSNLLSRSLPEDALKGKIMKQAGATGTKPSFTIDSLLGITSAAAQAAMHNCRLPSQATCHLDVGEGGKWVIDKQLDHLHQQRDTRFSPYSQHHGSSKKERDRHHPSISTSEGQTTEKGIDKSQSKPSRRAAKSKRVRTIFTPEQLERLEAEFERQQYMVGPERLYLASSLYLTEAQVKVWFQNRRIKWRKQHLEMQQQRLAVYRSKSVALTNDEEDEEFENDMEEDLSRPSTTIHSDSFVTPAHHMSLMTSFAGSVLRDPTSESPIVGSSDMLNVTPTKSMSSPDGPSPVGRTLNGHLCNTIPPGVMTATHHANK